MKDHQMLGAVDESGKPKEPVYELGPVLKRGDNCCVCGNTRLNHADYMDRKGYFDICQFFEDKVSLSKISTYFLGKLGHYLCQEADCETILACLNTSRIQGV